MSLVDSLRKTGLLLLAVVSAVGCRARRPTDQVATTSKAITAEPRIVLVVGSSMLSPSDAALRDRLVDMGVSVSVQEGPVVSAADCNGARAFVISESTSSTTVGARLTDVPCPVVSLEPALFDDLGMTGVRWMVDQGEVLQGASLVARAGSPLAAGLSNEVVIARSPAKVLWGIPGPQAEIGATLRGDPSRATVFGYRKGADMVTGKAPARRVGLFAGRDVPAAFTNAGWRLFEAAVRWAMTPERVALLVVGQVSPLSSGDDALHARLVARGFEVRAASGSTVQATDAAAADVVVISESTQSATVGGRLANVTRPIVSLEPALFDEFGMTGPSWGVDYGDYGNQTALRITANHPLAAQVPAGLVTVTSKGEKFVWARPNDGAFVAATIADRAELAVVFGYRRGQVLVGGQAAPARRVGFFAGLTAPAFFLEAGWRLFDAAVAWALDGSGCEIAAEGSACDDGNACTTGESCLGGACIGGLERSCATTGVCRVASCDPAWACTEASALDGEACSDEDSCTVGDACRAGACVAGPRAPSCMPGDPEPCRPENSAMFGPVVYRETFESCAEAWTDEAGREPPYIVDSAWAACSPSSGGRVQSLAASDTPVRSSWFRLIEVRPGQPYCLTAAVRWVAGPPPVIGVKRFDSEKVPLGSTAVMGPGLDLPPGHAGMWRRYRQTYVPAPDMRFAQIETSFASAPAFPSQSFVDDVAMYEGSCPPPS